MYNENVMNRKMSQEKRLVVALILSIFLIVTLTIINIVVFLNRRDHYGVSNEFYTVDQAGNRIYTAEVYKKAKELTYDDKQGIEEMIKILSHDEIEEYISDFKETGAPNLVCLQIGLNTGGYPVQMFYKLDYDETETSLVGYSTLSILYALSDEQTSSFDTNICDTKLGETYDTCDYKRIGYNLLYNTSITNSELIPTRYKTSLQDQYAKFQDSSADFICEIND